MKIQVLDKGFVSLVDHMGSDLSVVNAARVSFGKRTENFRPRDKKLIKYLWDHKHTSPFRHASVTLHIKAPIFVLRQWMKHKIASDFNEISGRYVDFEPEFYIPQVFREQSSDNKQGSEGSVSEEATRNALRLYEQELENCFSTYQRMRIMGVCKEQARMILPTALYSECYWTCSLQALMHFLVLREDSHAQWEIQEYARAVRELVSYLFPVSLSMD